MSSNAQNALFFSFLGFGLGILCTLMYFELLRYERFTSALAPCRTNSQESFINADNHHSRMAAYYNKFIQKSKNP
jgi:hypothetical protein